MPFHNWIPENSVCCQQSSLHSGDEEPQPSLLSPVSPLSLSLCRNPAQTGLSSKRNSLAPVTGLAEGGACSRDGWIQEPSVPRLTCSSFQPHPGLLALHLLSHWSHPLPHLVGKVTGLPPGLHPQGSRSLRLRETLFLSQIPQKALSGLGKFLCLLLWMPKGLGALRSTFPPEATVGLGGAVAQAQEKLGHKSSRWPGWCLYSSPPMLEVSGAHHGASSINRRSLPSGGLELQIQGEAAEPLASEFPRTPGFPGLASFSILFINLLWPGQKQPLAEGPCLGAGFRRLGLKIQPGWAPNPSRLFASCVTSSR